MAPRTRLNRAAVVDAAADLVDRQGGRALTMTALARALGVRGPSLYNHVAGLEDVVGAVQVRSHEELAARLQRATMGTSGPDALRSISMALRAFALEHPGLYDLAMSEPVDREHVLAASELSGAALAAVVASFDVPRPSPELFMSCVATLHGIVALDRAGLLDGVDDDAVFEQGVGLVAAMLAGERTATGAGHGKLEVVE